MLPLCYYMISRPKKPAGMYAISIVDADSVTDPPELIPGDPDFAPNPIMTAGNETIYINLNDYGYWRLDEVTTAIPPYDPVSHGGYMDYVEIYGTEQDLYVWVLNSWNV